MRMLAIETATEACSVALFEGDTLLDARHEVLGRGHAERLVPMIAGLPDKGRAAVVRVSLGPGSFTGVRIGLAVARSLGIAWQAEVLGYPTLALVAAMAREQAPAERAAVTVCMNGGHGEWFVQGFGHDGLPETENRSLPPADASSQPPHSVIAGNRASELAALLPEDNALVIDTLPDARSVPLLPEALLTRNLAPIYGRGPDAKLPG